MPGATVAFAVTSEFVLLPKDSHDIEHNIKSVFKLNFRFFQALRHQKCLQTQPLHACAKQTVKNA